MGTYIGSKSDAKRTGDKIVSTLEKQKSPWVQTLVSAIVGGVVVGLVVWRVQATVYHKTLTNGVAKTIAVAIANDLKFTPVVSESTRKGFIKRQFRTDPSVFESVYSPTVELPSAIDVASLEPDVTRALDAYKRHLSECAKHRKTYLSELRTEGKESTLQDVLLTYCVSLDAVVLTGFQLAVQLQTHYPATKDLLKGVPFAYRSMEADIQQIQEVLKSPRKAEQASTAGQAESTVSPKAEPNTPSDVQ